MKAFITLLLACIICASCQTNPNYETNIIHDTISVKEIIRDTVTIEDTETILYYKNQLHLLWKAIDLMEVKDVKYNAEIDRINAEIVSQREEHNRRARNNFFIEFEKLTHK